MDFNVWYVRTIDSLQNNYSFQNFQKKNMKFVFFIGTTVTIYW